MGGDLQVAHVGLLFRKKTKNVYLLTVPITIHWGRKRFDTYGLLDNCSQGTFIREDVVERLKLKTEKKSIEMGTINDSEVVEYDTVKVNVSSRDKKTSFVLEVALVAPLDKFNMPSSPPLTNEDGELYTHLDGLNLSRAWMLLETSFGQ